MDPLAWFKTFIGWIHAPLKTMIMIALLTGAALALPAPWQQKMDIWNLTRAHLALEWSIFLFCTGMVVLTGLEMVLKQMTAAIARYRHGREIEKHLRNLPLDQITVLSRFVESRKSSFMFDRYVGAVCDLEKRGILYQSSDVPHRMLGVYPFTITPEAMRYLRRPEFQKLLLDQKPD